MADAIGKFPPVSLALVEHLERLFPDRCPEINDAERMVWARVGSAAVVRFLRGEHEKQNKTVFAKE